MGKALPQTIYVLPQPLLDSSIKGGEIALGVWGKLDGIGHKGDSSGLKRIEPEAPNLRRRKLDGNGHESDALELQILLDLLPRNQSAGLLHDLPRLFQIPPIFESFENRQILR